MKYSLIILLFHFSANCFSQTKWVKVNSFDPKDEAKIKEVEKAVSDILKIEEAESPKINKKQKDYNSEKEKTIEEARNKYNEEKKREYEKNYQDCVDKWKSQRNLKERILNKNEKPPCTYTQIGKFEETYLYKELIAKENEKYNNIDGCILGDCSNSGVYINSDKGKGITYYRGNFVNSSNVADLRGSKYYSRYDSEGRNRGVRVWHKDNISGATFYKNETPLRHGFGSLLLPDYSFYMGEFQYNKIDGFGIMIYHPNLYYIGQWDNGQWNGEGKKVSFGEISEGIWKNGVFHESSNKCPSESVFKASFPNFILNSEVQLGKLYLGLKPNLKDFDAIFNQSNDLWAKYNDKVKSFGEAKLGGYDLTNYDIECLKLSDVVKNWRLNNLSIRNKDIKLLAVTLHKRELGGEQRTLYFFQSMNSEKLVLIDLNAINSIKK